MAAQSFPFEHGADLRRQVKRNLDAFAVRTIDDEQARHAAVAITLVPNGDGQACFVLTRRALRLKHHGGQFALPGGKLEGGESVVSAALRELAEEVGLSLEASAVLGRLDDYATRSGFVISPLVVWCPDARPLDLDPAEVAHAYRVALGALDRPDAPVISRIPETERPVLSMPLLGGLVHAPTAAFLYQFIEVALRGLDTRVAHFDQPVFAWS